jgi:hypothetical protein
VEGCGVGVELSVCSVACADSTWLELCNGRDVPRQEDHGAFTRKT